MSKVLVVVDYQKDFVDGALGFPKAAELEEGIRKLVEEFDQGNANGFIYQVEEAVSCIENGKLESEVASHQMTLDCCKIFDKCFE